MNDTYRELIERLRQGVTQPTDGGEATRERILRDLSQARPGSRPSRTLLLLAAAFFVSTAFALYIASPVAREAEAARRAPSVAAPAVQAPAPPPLAPATSASEQAKLPVPVEPTPDAAASTPGPSVRTRASRRPSSAVAAPTPAPASADTSTSAPAPSAAPASAPQAVRPAVSPQQRQVLYIEAHRQHFRGSPQQALAAWDAFLATDPVGPLLLEARYNRAVSLVRLGRRTEAERALQPFARGEHGGFRQAEAEQLLKQLKD